MCTPKYEEKNPRVTRPGWSSLPGHVPKKELQKLRMQNSILSIEIMRSGLEYIMCNFHPNKGPHELEPWEKKN